MAMACVRSKNTNILCIKALMHTMLKVFHVVDGVDVQKHVAWGHDLTIVPHPFSCKSINLALL